MESIDQVILDMKKAGDALVEYTYPKADAALENEIYAIRGRDVIVDGYHLSVYYSKADYGKYYLEVFQVIGKWLPFVPFTVVCKLVKKFLGHENLSMMEVFFGQRKAYVWMSITDLDGKSLPPVQNTIADFVFEDLKYHYVDPQDVNFI